MKRIIAIAALAIATAAPAQANTGNTTELNLRYRTLGILKMAEKYMGERNYLMACSTYKDYQNTLFELGSKAANSDHVFAKNAINTVCKGIDI